MRPEEVFKQALEQLQEGLRSFERATEFFPSEKLPDILNTELIVKDLPETGIYDHQWLQRKFFISSSLVESFRAFWEGYNSSGSSKSRMCKLFFLHEFIHLGQRIDSNTYAHSRNTKDSVADFDYAADAAAVEVLFHLEHSSVKWNEHLASILRDHILCGEAFSYADDKRESTKISGARLKRQMVWHLQYSRAVSYKPEKTFDDFAIADPLNVELLKLDHIDRRTNLVNETEVDPNDLKMIELHVSWHGERIIHALTLPAQTGNLILGLFDYDFDATVQAFRSLFDKELQLVGRGLPTASKSDPVNVNHAPVNEETFWKQIEDISVELLPEGPNENEFWSRSGGEKSALRTNHSGRAQWHIAINLIKNGGGGITAQSLLNQLRREYPGNSQISSLIEKLEITSR